MSLNCPEITVSGKQYITNADNEQVEFTVHNNHLYVMTNENGIRIGATIMLESLPDVALYGQNGLSTADGINFILTLSEQDFSEWTTEDTNALIDIITQETGAQQVIITIEEGSVKASVEMVIGNNVDDTTMNTFLEKVDTVQKLNTILAGSTHTKLQTCASQNNSIETPTFVPVRVTIPQIISVSIDDTVTVDTIGKYEYFEWKSNGQWIRLPSPILPTNFGDLEGDHSIEFRFLNPQSLTLKEQTFNITFPQKIPNINHAYSFNNTLNDKQGAVHLPDTWESGTYNFVNGGNDKYALAPAGVMNTNQLYGDRHEFTVAFWVKYIRPPVAGDSNLFFDAGVRSGNQRAHLNVIGHGPWIGTLGDTVNPLRMKLINIWGRPFSDGELDDIDKNPTYDQIYNPDWAYHIISWKHGGHNGQPGGWMKYWVNGVLVSDLIPSNWWSTSLRAFERIGMNTPQYIVQDMVFYETAISRDDVAMYMYNNPWVDPSPGPAPPPYFPPPTIYAAYSFDGDLNSSVGTYHLPTTWQDWANSTYEFSAGRNGKMALKMMGVSPLLTTLFADAFPKSSISWSVWIKFLRQPQDGEGLFDWQHGGGALKMQFGIYQWQTGAGFYSYPGVDTTIASADFYSTDWKLHTMSVEHPGSPGAGGTLKYWIDGVKLVDVVPGDWKGTEISAPNHFWIGYNSSDGNPFFLMQDLTFYETSMTDGQAQSLSQ